ncbi:hypothetical protein CsSME_00022924 [Camellia sinensis var. sinensis]|uniref:aldehyde oxidase GLOX1-like n=1 Tax=Camellia sinensis TaxID=4442 RepID=UPI0010364145|nr:aldehyde oxidase GLOX1-like [Camellia sinensis]
MATLLKSLFLISLLFFSATAYPFFIEDPDPTDDNLDAVITGRGYGGGLPSDNNNGGGYGGGLPIDNNNGGGYGGGLPIDNNNLGGQLPSDDNNGGGQLPGDTNNGDEQEQEQKQLPKGGKNGGNEGSGVNKGGNGVKKPNFETKYLGEWKIDNPNSGVSSMQLQLLPNNKVIMFDATSLGPSNIQLQPAGNCRPVPNKTDEYDCWAHAVEYDIETSKVRTLKVLTNAWCSSGGLAADGTLINTGGFQDGGRAVRQMGTCDGCDWVENPALLAGFSRWYSTQEKLEDGSFILFGGRREFSYEIVQTTLNYQSKKIDFPFLKETTDKYENNLYPFAYLLPDTTVFLLANNRSIIMDPKSGKIIRELPVLPNGSRNYPASAMSALLPLKISGDTPDLLDAEVLVCGGAKPDGMEIAGKGRFIPALQDCNRIVATKPGAKWEVDQLPARRVMGDMLILPNADLLILNGAMDGVAGWNMAETPILTPHVYSPDKPLGQRFKAMNPSTIPRMYHSSSAVLPDGKILVAGSNTNPMYLYKVGPKVKYPTELRVEKFTPYYLDPALDAHRPEITEAASDNKLSYGQRFNVVIKLNDEVEPEDIKVTMLAPPFTTHGYSQNQRMLVLDAVDVVNGQLTVVAPPSGAVAPPGYYLLFVVHRGVPSRGIWVQIQ